MATGDRRVFAAKGASHGGTAIASATHFSVGASTVKVRDPGPAGSPGMAAEQVTHRDVTVSVYAMDPGELLALVGAAAANFVGTYIGLAGADKTVTVKNVVFNDPPTDVISQPADAGGTCGRYQLTGRGTWGASDTFALMQTWN
jgi:hypothetical protein